MNRAAHLAGTTLKRLRPLMGTFVAVEATHVNESGLSAAIDEAFTAIADIELSMHPDRRDSDLARIRYAFVDTEIAVRPSTIRVLRVAREVWEKSQGVFDPCLPDASGSMQDLVIGEKHVIARKPMHIDLGGIAKGYAVDVALDILIDRGCDSGIVNAGGDMRSFGAPVEIFVRCGDETRQRVLENSAIAVSDTTALEKPTEHRGYYRRDGSAHLFARGAVVSASHAAVADALTKCLLLSANDEAQAVLQQFNATAEVW